MIQWNEDLTKPTRIGFTNDVSRKLLLARDRWLMAPDKTELRHELLELLELLDGTNH